jgi:hypothetical protein
MKTIVSGILAVAAFCVFFLLMDLFLMKLQGLQLFPS